MEEAWWRWHRIIVILLRIRWLGGGLVLRSTPPSVSKPVAEALIWAGGVKGEENGSHFGRGRSTQLIIYLESLIGL